MYRRRSTSIGTISVIPLGGQISIIELFNTVGQDWEFTRWASEYKILTDIFPDIFPLVMSQLTGCRRIRMEYYPNANNVVLSLRCRENFCFDIPETLRKFLFRPEEESGFEETIVIKRAAPVTIIKDQIVPDSAIYINSCHIPCMVIDVVNEKNIKAFQHRFGTYVAAKGQIRFSIVISTKDIDMDKGLKKIRSTGKVYISAYEITAAGVQALHFKSEIWPHVPEEEEDLALDGIWEVHSHVPLKILHDKICKTLGRGKTSITHAVRKATKVVFKGFHRSSKKGKGKGKEPETEVMESELPIKDKCTEVNLGRRVTIWRKPSGNPPNLVLEHKL